MQILNGTLFILIRKTSFIRIQASFWSFYRASRGGPMNICSLTFNASFCKSLSNLEWAGPNSKSYNQWHVNLYPWVPMLANWHLPMILISLFSIHPHICWLASLGGHLGAERSKKVQQSPLALIVIHLLENRFPLKKWSEPCKLIIMKQFMYWIQVQALLP